MILLERLEICLYSLQYLIIRDLPVMMLVVGSLLHVVI
jgi:hypothetical protein